MNTISLEVCLTGCDNKYFSRNHLNEAKALIKERLDGIFRGCSFSLDSVCVYTDSGGRWGGDIIIYSVVPENELEDSIRKSIGVERLVQAVEEALIPVYQSAYGTVQFKIHKVYFKTAAGEPHFKLSSDAQNTAVGDFCRKLTDEFQSSVIKKLPLSSDVRLDEVLKSTLYLTADERRMVIYRASLIANERGAESVSTADISTALADFQIFKKGGVEDKTNYIEKLSEQFAPIEPSRSFDQLIITDKARQEIELALITINPQTKVKYEKWGLLSLDGHPRSVLNFYGPPGTGKTMAAHAIARKFGKKIIIASCHSLQSKWHGESSKNVKAAFCAAEKHNAILFFDEADSLISQRLEEVHSGSEDEINNMRNTILTCLEEHTGIVIFASNFVKRYDFAFETRIQSVLFPLPDMEMLESLWKVHLPMESLPGAKDVDCRKLAEATLPFAFCGRDVKNAVLRACKVAIAKGKDKILEDDLLEASTYIQDSRTELKENSETIHKRLEKDVATVDTIENFAKKQIDGFAQKYLSGIPLADGFDVFAVSQKMLYFSEKEIRQIVTDACFVAHENHETVLTVARLEEVIHRYRPRKEQDEAYDTLLEAVQAIINRKVQQQ